MDFINGVMVFQVGHLVEQEQWNVSRNISEIILPVLQTSYLMVILLTMWFCAGLVWFCYQNTHCNDFVVESRNFPGIESTELIGNALTFMQRQNNID